jgi:signal transduction histidine kinase
LQQNEALYAYGRRLSDWVQFVSHDLRKPLTTIGGGLELILACEPGLSPTTRDTLAIVRAQSLRLGHLVAMIMDERALAAGQPCLHLGAVTLRPSVEAILREQPPSRQANIAIADAFPAVWADADALGHVLAQLLDHAFKYADGPVTIAAEVQGRRAVLTMSADLPLSDGADDKLATAGRLVETPDLVITRALVEAMGGILDGEGTHGRSFTLRLSLPLALAPGSLPVEE